MLGQSEQHSSLESSADVDAPGGHMTLDALLQQLAASQSQYDSSKAVASLARQALDLGSKQVRTSVKALRLQQLALEADYVFLNSTSG